MARTRSQQLGAPARRCRPPGRSASASPAHRVADPQLDRVHAERLRPACPSATRARSTPAPRRSRASRRTAGCSCRARSASMSTLSHAYGPTAKLAALRRHRRRARRVRAAVEHDRRPDVHELAVAVGAVLEAHPGRVPVDVAVEGLLAGVDHLHRPVGAQRQQAGVDLHRDVLAGAERAADAGQRAAAPCRPAGRGVGDLALVDVQPLGGDVEVDAAVARPGPRARTRGRGRPGPACRPRTRR